MLGMTEHDLCLTCWDSLFPNVEPNMEPSGVELCCNCGTKTADGISVYGAPDTYPHPSPFTKGTLVNAPIPTAPNRRKKK